jgi:hypothetical protein
MKIKIIAVSVIAACAAIITACGGGTTNTANTSNTANANKPANTANTAANSSNSSNSTSSTSNSTTDTDKDKLSSTSGDVVNLDSSGIKMTVPKGFGMEKDGDALNVTSPDKSITVIFLAVEGKDFEEATKGMAAVLDKGMKNVKVEEEGTKDELNGMETISSSGTGVDKETNKNLVWSLAAIKTPKKPVLVTIIGEKDNIEKHSADFKAMFDSLKKQ